MQKRKTIVIIGAGIAGLSAGIYAEQHGLHAILLKRIQALVVCAQAGIVKDIILMAVSTG